MKKLTLSSLSREALDRTQENLVTGGGLPSCICAHICGSCGCLPEFYSTESSYDRESNDEANVEGDDTRDPN